MLLEKAEDFAAQSSRPLRHVRPDRVRSHLRSNISIIPDNVSSMVLEYCLLDALQRNPTTSVRQAIYEDLRTIPLWPTVDGRLRDLVCSTLMFPRNSEELSLFAPSRPEVTINIEKITKQVKASVGNDVALGICALVTLRTLADLVSDWPYIYQSPETQNPDTQESIVRTVKDDSLIQRVWAWAEKRFNEEKKFPTDLHNLWLLPVKGNHIRRFMPGNESRPMLIVESTETLYKLMELDSLPSDQQAVFAQILECQLLSPDMVRILHQQVEKTPAMRAASSVDFKSLVHWLVANVALVTRMPEAQTRKLLERLEQLARSKWPNTLGLMNDPACNELARQLKRLPLFSRQSAEVPYK